MDNNSKNNRTSKLSLTKLAESASVKDKVLLLSVHSSQYLTTNQIARLVFWDAPKPATGVRRASRATTRLKELRLINHLNRRIGGARAGSGSYVWHLTEAGHRLLRLTDGILNNSRSRTYEPAENNLKHTLAVAEIHIKLFELDKSSADFNLIDHQHEPRCWRTYTDIGGTPVLLKPDLFAHTTTNEYEDFYFFEMDCGTESPSRVVNKCKQYIRYYNLGIEQRKNGLFPFVIWVTPDQKRRDTLTRHIQKELDNYLQLFRIVTMDELEVLVDGDESKSESEGKND